MHPAFDFVRTSHSKKELDLDAQTIFGWGVQAHQLNGCQFFRVSEVQNHIIHNSRKVSKKLKLQAQVEVTK